MGTAGCICHRGGQGRDHFATTPRIQTLIDRHRKHYGTGKSSRISSATPRSKKMSR
jgi:hypothetical protein